MTDQPTLGLVTGLAGNPPYALPVSSTATGLTMLNAYTLAGAAGIAPISVAHNYHDAYISEWNFGVEQQFANSFKVTAQYVGSKGTDLNIERNYNQLINGARPYTALSASSPIDPGVALTNIDVYESDGNSSYNALWVTAQKRFSKGLQFNANYSWSKSIDDNSKNVQGVVIQNSYNIAGDRGLSDFNVPQRFVLSGIYDLPFQGNRLKDGWRISMIEQVQAGSPINFTTGNASFTGIATLRPDVTGPVVTGYTPATNGSPQDVTYIQNPGVFVYPGNAFGTLGRNAIQGPGFSNLDIALVKNTKITERITWQFRADAFDVLNQHNFTNPVTALPTPAGGAGTAFVASPTSTFGLITGGTRFPAGDFGSSRQLQLAMKLIF
jgi:hypothetical protein